MWGARAKEAPFKINAFFFRVNFINDVCCPKDGTRKPSDIDDKIGNGSNVDFI